MTSTLGVIDLKRLLASLVAPCILSTLLAGAAVAADDPTAGSVEEMTSVVYVDTAGLRYTGGDPAEVELHISGTMPTPCHQPAWEVEQGPEAVRVWLWSVSTADAAGASCAAVLEPVELVIGLGQVDPATPVLLDGEPVTDVVDTPAGESTALTAAGWSFGMCLGYCAADLEIDGDALTLSGWDREDSSPILANQGALTADGRARLDSAAQDLDLSALEPVDGCPDCADGGAAYLQLQTAEGESRYEMEFGAPPAPLGALYGLAIELIDALESCTSGELVTVAEDCVAYVRPSD